MGPVSKFGGFINKMLGTRLLNKKNILNIYIDKLIHKYIYACIYV